jgi:hypothetical protein
MCRVALRGHAVGRIVGRAIAQAATVPARVGKGGLVRLKTVRERRRAPVALILAVTATLPAPAAAQTQWVVPTTIGYPAAGLAAGVAAFGVADAAGAVLAPIGVLGGLIIGYRVGRRADDALDRGDSLTSAHRWAVRAGTVFTGGVVGAGVAMVLINPEGASSVGSDEAIFAGSVLGGAALGALAQYVLDDRLWPHARLRVGVGPRVGPGRRQAPVLVGLTLR